MSDKEVSALLDSDKPLVVIEAPAGCGKTYQASCYADRAASELDTGRVLILTHTHAACGVFAKATQGKHNHVEIRTIDSLIVQIAAAYHKSLDLPVDPYVWAQQDGSFSELANRVAALVTSKPMISEALANRYPMVIGDEHQDSSEDQDAIIMSLFRAGSCLRIFGDPMQRIYGRKNKTTADADRKRWEDMKSAGAFMELETPHRWRDGSQELGQWILQARRVLKDGNPVDLSGTLPTGLLVICVENLARTRTGFSLSRHDRRPIDRIVSGSDNLLVLTSQNETVDSLTGFWNRRLPIWEGHTRDALEKLVNSMDSYNGNPVQITEALVVFLMKVAVGFSPSSHGNRLVQEVASGCTARARGKPALIQELGQFIIDEPNHVGVSKCLMRLSEHIEQQIAGFESVKIDYRREFKDAIRLIEFSDPAIGMTEINRRRSFAHPMPPQKSVSTIHKAKGLECDNAIIVPCDRQTFSTSEYARCKLYVALSRAKRTLTLVLSSNNPSPLFYLG
ncbi:MAG: ATP-dependent helicase [Candidatus Thiodiazotropha sp. (ex Epidulcina cf. delphinae)]|nr:ATP-dependent helicase [Candidatus Thiodiazotropha sp. (ex Epidulcina cf. delphinae)]